METRQHLGIYKPIIVFKPIYPFLTIPAGVQHRLYPAYCILVSWYLQLFNRPSFKSPIRCNVNPSTTDVSLNVAASTIIHRRYEVQGHFVAGTLRYRGTLSKGRIVQGKTFRETSAGDTSSWYHLYNALIFTCLHIKHCPKTHFKSHTL